MEDQRADYTMAAMVIKKKKNISYHTKFHYEAQSAAYYW